MPFSRLGLRFTVCGYSSLLYQIWYPYSKETFSKPSMAISQSLFLTKTEILASLKLPNMNFTFLSWLKSKFGHQKVQKMEKIVKVANHKTNAVCGLRLSWLKNFSHTVSRLDLPTLDRFLNLHTLKLKFFREVNFDLYST